MIKQKKPTQPIWLAANYQTWGTNYQTRLAANPNHIFQWTTHSGQRVNKKLEPFLLTATLHHCSFCDSFPMQEQIMCTIEHFKPKKQNPLISYKYSNLFMCCSICQQKNDEWNKYLLKPDVASYQFDKYFVYNARSGEIEVNGAASSHMQKRASETIRIYRLNENNRPKSRRRYFKQYNKTENPVIEEFPFRYIY